MPSELEYSSLRDILTNIDLAAQFVQGQSLEALGTDVMRRYAVVRTLEIISEASRRLSDELKARHPGMPWREMAAAGNFYRHDYEQVTVGRLWKTVHDDLPALRKVIEQELANYH
jgi:uncharacterized protein with HEPN domain